MTKITVAIIAPNKLTYSNVEMTHSRFEKFRIEDDIEDFVEFVELDNMEEVLGQIINTLNLSPETVAHTTVCKEDSKYIYQMCHIIDEAKNKQQNNIAIRLANSKYRIVDSVVLLKDEIMADGTTMPCNITINDVIELYQECLIKSCIRINVDDTIDDVKYIFNPIDWMNKELVPNIRFHEIQFADKVMMFFIELNPIKNVLNNQASILYGREIYGDVVIAMRHKPEDIRHTAYEYYNIDSNIVRKLVAIFSVPKDKLKTEEPKKISTKQVVNNFCMITDRKYNLYKTLYKEPYSLEVLETFKTSKSLNQQSIEMINNAKLTNDTTKTE